MRFAFQVELCQNGDTFLDSSIKNASEEKAKIRSTQTEKKTRQIDRQHRPQSWIQKLYGKRGNCIYSTIV